MKDGWSPALEYDNGGVVIAAIRYGTMNEALDEASEMLGCMSDYPDAFTNNHPAPNQMIDLSNDQGEAREELAEEIKFHHRTHSELVQIQCQMQDVIRQRDEARAEMIRWMSIAEGRGRTDDDDTGKAMAKLIRQRDEAREQRDRLAELHKMTWITAKHLNHSAGNTL